MPRGGVLLGSLNLPGTLGDLALKRKTSHLAVDGIRDWISRGARGIRGTLKVDRRKLCPIWQVDLTGISVVRCFSGENHLKVCVTWQDVM